MTDSRKKILLVATDFPPNPSVGRLRTVKFAKYLPGTGWEPQVIAPAYRYFFGRDERLLQEIPKDCPVHRAFFPALLEIAACLIGGRSSARTVQEIEPSTIVTARFTDKNRISINFHTLFKSFLMAPLKLWRQMVSRYLFIPDPFVLWIPFALLKAFQIHSRERFDVLFTSIPAPSLIIMGYIMKSTTGVKWVIDYRDLWNGDHTRENLSLWRQAVERYLERLIAKKADLIIATSESKVNYLKRFLNRRNSMRFQCITNGFDPEDFPDFDKESSKKNKNLLKLVYTGRLYRTLSAVPFIEALGQAVKEVPSLKWGMRVHFIGDVAPLERDRMNSVIDDYDITQVVDFTRYVTYSQALVYQLKADALLLLMNHARNADGVIPTKVFEYLGAGRPILAVVPPGDAARIVRQTGRGLTVAPDDIGGIKRAILKLYSLFRESKLWETFQDNHHADLYTRRNLTEKLARLIEDLP